MSSFPLVFFAGFKRQDSESDVILLLHSSINQPIIIVTDGALLEKLVVSRCVYMCGGIFGAV